MGPVREYLANQRDLYLYYCYCSMVDDYYQQCYDGQFYASADDANVNVSDVNDFMVDDVNDVVGVNVSDCATIGDDAMGECANVSLYYHRVTFESNIKTYFDEVYDAECVGANDEQWYDGVTFKHDYATTTTVVNVAISVAAYFSH